MQALGAICVLAISSFRADVDNYERVLIIDRCIVYVAFADR